MPLKTKINKKIKKRNTKKRIFRRKKTKRKNSKKRKSRRIRQGGSAVPDETNKYCRKNILKYVFLHPKTKWSLFSYYDKPSQTRSPSSELDFFWPLSSRLLARTTDLSELEKKEAKMIQRECNHLRDDMNTLLNEPTKGEPTKGRKNDSDIIAEVLYKYDVDGNDEISRKTALNNMVNDFRDILEEEKNKINNKIKSLLEEANEVDREQILDMVFKYDSWIKGDQIVYKELEESNRIYDSIDKFGKYNLTQDKGYKFAKKEFGYTPHNILRAPLTVFENWPKQNRGRALYGIIKHFIDIFNFIYNKGITRSNMTNIYKNLSLGTIPEDAGGDTWVKKKEKYKNVMKSPKEIQDAFIEAQKTKWKNSLSSRSPSSEQLQEKERFKMNEAVNRKKYYSRKEFGDIHKKSIIRQEKEKLEFKKWAIADAAV